jgi:hypothetical protein
MFNATFTTNLSTFTVAIEGDSIEAATAQAEKTVRGSNRAGRYMRLVKVEEAIGDLDVWSDVYKDAHGVRPRHTPTWATVADYIADMGALQEIITQDEADRAARHSFTGVGPTPAPRATLADLWPAC